MSFIRSEDHSGAALNADSVPGAGKRACYQERYSASIVILCWLTYFIAYLGRYNYNACIVEIIAEYGISRAEAGAAGSFFFFAYMIGQAVHAVLSRRANSPAFIAAALILAAVLNVCMLFAKPGNMKILWCLNGIVQSALWPHIVKILTTLLPEKRVAGGMVLMHTTGAAGSAGAFLVTAVCLKQFSWRAAFVIPAILMAAYGIIWGICMGFMSKRINENPPEQDNSMPDVQQSPAKRGRSFRILISGGFLFAAMGAIGNGFLRDGITIWLPGYIHDTFHVESAIAVFISTIIPLAQVGGPFFAKKIYSFNRKPFLSAFILYGITFLSALVIVAGGRNSGIFLSCVCFALCATMMTAVNTALVSFYPLTFRAQGLTALASGTVNAFVYIGSITASSSFGLAADRLGWNAVLLMICGASVFSGIFCAAGSAKSRGSRTPAGPSPRYRIPGIPAPPPKQDPRD
ncbi:MAG: MFS transporter [Treponema sp.]|nr:MFS transporter [Treponema sp.]